ncbi:hydantoinase/oxoprolinase family protein [Terriglobus albidus]|uniref:hydantoinase/oxoprolinase family protein n=1 Tax=Terriglobus albidus TaxID=1592106 RepID=UPI0021E0655B|nr:hydantoinase/oxoprolinase family protein [Terriglobus albidus]
MRIAIDSGGTFTDCVYLAGGEVRVLKLFSTPADPSRAVLDAVKQVTTSPVVPEVRHGTTVGTNAMLERKGARVAFVTTAGFEDTIAIGRQARTSLYDWFRSPLPSVVPKELRFGVDERVTAEGLVLRAPSEDSLRQLAMAIQNSGAEAIAISLLFSFANPVNETRVAEALKPLGLPISISHRILPEFREYERGSTIVTNAYLSPKVSTYLHRLETEIDAAISGGSVQVMQSSGGIITAAIAAEEPVRTVLSGPAGGVMGAYRLARLAGFDKIIAFDMGGTSTDVSLIDAAEGGPRTTSDAVISEMPVSVPMLDIHTVGAGGGSIARFDAGGALHVGPESAGAVPGPICYGRGTLPTVTDANLALGRLDPDLFLGGKVRLDDTRALQWMEEARGGLASVEQFTAGIVLLAETAMEKAIRVISIERGYDPREFTLVSFGGAGPLHACSMARSLQIPRVLVPRLPGALSALGILLADTVRDYSRTVMLPAANEEMLTIQLQELEAQATEELQRQGLPREAEYSAERSIDLRYVGQGYELNVPYGANHLAEFHSLHRKRYGYASAETPVQAVNVRVRVTICAAPVDLPKSNMIPGNGSQAVLKTRPIYFNGTWRESNVYQREQLKPGDRFAGPALIAEYSATTVVPPGCIVEVDAFGNLVIEVYPA